MWKTKREESPVHQKAVFSDVKPAVSSDVKVRDKAAFSPVNQKNADVSQTTGRRPENQRAVSLQKGSSRTQSSVFETETLPDQSMFETETIKEPVSIFAQGLPDWTVTPPEVPVRRKRRK